MQITGKHLVIAHRGAAAYAPENTLPAFELAADMNAFGVELDVMYTKDGEIVVSHDWDLVRICGAKGFVHEMTLEELRKHNFAGEFAVQYGHVEIPTLEEVYNLLGPRGLYVNVELKDPGAEFARKVHDIALKCGMQDKVFYSGFDHYALADLVAYDPEIFVAPLYFARVANPGAYGRIFGAKAIHPPYEQMLEHPEAVKQAHDVGVRVHACVSDDPDTIRRLFEIGVDGIITNKPDVALEVANSFE